jgi:hypothetical protein
LPALQELEERNAKQNYKMTEAQKQSWALIRAAKKSNLNL